jgi:uncharacterized repeat protein (TIGR03803 family)
MRINLALQLALTLLWQAPANILAQTYTVLHYFTPADGSVKPDGGLVLSGTTFYGTTCGPYPRTNSDLGAVFEMNIDGSGFMVLKKFMGADGSAPWRELVLSGTTLYGVTREGGAGGNGTVFRLNTDGSGFSNLKMFPSASPDGSDLYGGAALSGNTLFGTAVQGGITNAYDEFGCGTVFRINTDGSGFNVLHAFNGDDGMHPDGGVVVSGDTLFGTTDCTVFRVNSDGSNFQILECFTNAVSDGQGPDSLLILSSVEDNAAGSRQ